MKTEQKIDHTTDLLKLMDFLCIINALDGQEALNPDRPANEGDEAIDAYHARRKKRRINLERQRRMIYDMMLNQATKMLKAGVPITRLDEVLRSVGWSDNQFVVDGPSVVIVEK
jgi:hypothetical protein